MNKENARIEQGGDVEFT